MRAYLETKEKSSCFSCVSERLALRKTLLYCFLFLFFSFFLCVCVSRRGNVNSLARVLVSSTTTKLPYHRVVDVLFEIGAG